MKLAFTVNATTPGQVTINNVAQLYLPLGGSVVSSNQTVTPLSPTAIALDRFEAQNGDSGVLVHWQTSLEQNVFGFNLLRSRANAIDGAMRVNPDLIAARGSALGASYDYADAAGYGRDYYWLEEIELDGSRIVHGPVVAATGSLKEIGGVAIERLTLQSHDAVPLVAQITQSVLAQPVSSAATGGSALPQSAPAADAAADVLQAQPLRQAISPVMRAKLTAAAMARARMDISAHQARPLSVAGTAPLEKAGAVARTDVRIVIGANDTGVRIARGHIEPLIGPARARPAAMRAQPVAGTMPFTLPGLFAAIIGFALAGVVMHRRRAARN